MDLLSILALYHMKKILIVANWKSYKTTSEAKSWIEILAKDNDASIKSTSKTVVVCPSYTLLFALANFFQQANLTFVLGGQNISPFQEGAYTGEINAKQLQEFCKFVIIGHSERRATFNEDNLVLAQKVTMAKQYNLEPIFCIQSKETFVPENVKIVAYEPISAIGTGNPDTPENANEVAKTMKKRYSITHVLYGGSVTKDNVKSFTNMSDIDGILVGSASLNPLSFLSIIINA